MQCLPRGHCRVDIYILSAAGRKSSSHSFTEACIEAWFTLRKYFQCLFQWLRGSLPLFRPFCTEYFHVPWFQCQVTTKKKAFLKEDKERLFWFAGGRCLSRACLLLRKVAVVQICRSVCTLLLPLPINHPLLLSHPHSCPAQTITIFVSRDFLSIHGLIAFGRSYGKSDHTLFSLVLLKSLGWVVRCPVWGAVCPQLVQLEEDPSSAMQPTLSRSLVQVEPLPAGFARLLYIWYMN